MDRLREGMGDKVGLFVHYVSTFATGFATGFVESWELTLVIMSVTPLLAFASAFLGNVSPTVSGTLLRFEDCSTLFAFDWPKYSDTKCTSC